MRGFDQLNEIGEGPAVLACGDGDATVPAHTRHGGIVLRRPDGFLDPQQIVRREFLRHRDGLVGCPGTSTISLMPGPIALRATATSAVPISCSFTRE
jgi:hypothetical protein